MLEGAHYSDETSADIQERLRDRRLEEQRRETARRQQEIVGEAHHKALIALSLAHPDEYEELVTSFAVMLGLS